MINKRVFGSPIPINVQKKLEARQLVAIGDKNPEDSIQSQYPDENDISTDGAYYFYDEQIASNFKMQGDLSSRTPFARMWTAVALVNEREFQTNTSTESQNESTEESVLASAKADNELDKINSILQKIKYKELERTVYIVGTHNLSTLDNSLNPHNSNSEIHRQIFPPEHGVEGDDNQFLKPQAGITSVTSETEGIMGSIKKTTVNFVVHNFHDYDKIYSKFFLRPGAQIFVDFGWDTLQDFDGEPVELYDPRDLLSIDASGDQSANDIGVEQKLYGVAGKSKGVTEDGFVTQCNGDVETLIGIVTNYESKLKENGTVECSLTITSKNSALMLYPKHVGENTTATNMKFEFDLDNLIFYEQAYNLGTIGDRQNLETGVEKLANSSNSVEDEAGFENFLNSVKWRTFGSKTYIPTVMAGITGLFVVGDEEPDDSYISWGLLEDKIFTKYFGHGDDASTIPEDEDGKFTVRMNSSDGFTAFENGFLLKQAQIEKPPNFLIPYFWDITYNRPQDGSNKQSAGLNDTERVSEFLSTAKEGYSDYGDIGEFNKKMGEVKEGMDEFIEKVYKNSDSNTGYSPGNLPGQRPVRIYMGDEGLITKYDKEVKRVPIREIFVSTQVVKDAFKNENNQTFKAVVQEILDAINDDSYGLWDWQITGEENILKINDMNFSHAAVGTKDERQSEFDKMFRFHVMSKDSIVRDYEVSFEMPDGDIGSMYAIQAMTGTPAKMNPITTVIESHSALQTILNKYNKDLDKIGFRYLPDLGAYNALNMASQQFNQEQKLKYYRDVGKEYGGKQTAMAQSTYGTGVGVTHPNVVWAESEQEKAKKKDKFGNETPSHNTEQRLELVNKKAQEEGKTVVGSIDDYYEYKITGEFITEDHFKAIPLPMKLELTIYGIGTLKPGDTFRVDYLPELYMDFVYFQVLNVSHNIGSDGWYTTLETQFRISPHRYEDSNMYKAPANSDDEEQENLKQILQDNNVNLTDADLILAKVSMKENEQKAEPPPVILDPSLLKGGELLSETIEDGRAYMWDDEATSFSTRYNRYDGSYWQRPSLGKFKPYQAPGTPNYGWDYVKADITKTPPRIKGVMVKRKKSTSVQADYTVNPNGNGDSFSTQEVITNRNFKSLTGYMTNLTQLETKGKYTYFDRLFTFEVESKYCIYIASPLYYWSEELNRYNGYGHYNAVYGNNTKQKTYVGGIFWPREKVYLFINSEDPKRWWGVHPFNSTWDLKRYDVPCFDPNWDASEWADEGWDAGNTPDQY